MGEKEKIAFDSLRRDAVFDGKVESGTLQLMDDRPTTDV